MSRVIAHGVDLVEVERIKRSLDEHCERFVERCFTKAEAEYCRSARPPRDVERFAGIARFMPEIDRRGYQVAENAGQFVIFCNRAPVRWLTPSQKEDPRIL